MRLVCLACFCLVVVGARGVSAQEPSRAEARELFLRADTLLTSGRFAEARDLLRRSFDAFPTAPTAFNLAIAARGVGRSVEAVAWLDRLAEGELGPLDEARLGEVRALRAEIEREIATLSIEACGGEGTEVRVDGEVWLGFDGCQTGERALDAGSYVLEVRAPRHLPWRRRIFASRGESLALRVQLEPVPTGRLVVRVPHDEVVVEVEGVGSGVGGFRRELPVGPYRVSAALDPTEVRDVEVEAGRLVEVEFGRRARLRRRRAGIAATVIGVATGALVLGLVLSRDEPYRDPVFGRTET
ncbi:MAG: hypothetical protein R3B99_00090 [Polyangiales bacterium]|nr:tetratricopeptide repeat protein [Myxococcales bacterium]